MAQVKETTSTANILTIHKRLDADQGIYTEHMMVCDDSNKYSGVDNFDGYDIDTYYYAKGILASNSDNGDIYTYSFPAVSGTLLLDSSVATESISGPVKLGSDTEQSVAANSVTATTNRTYAIQKNSNGQLVVNVPWLDTNTNTVYRILTQTLGTTTDGIRPDSTVSLLKYARETRVYAGSVIRQFIYDVLITPSASASNTFYIQSCDLYSFLNHNGIASSSCLSYISVTATHNASVNYLCNACVSAYSTNSGWGCLTVNVRRSTSTAYDVGLHIVVNSK